MIEATCSGCGTLNRIAEADVPAGAKLVNCTTCSSPITLPANAGAAKPGPGMPRMPPPIPKGFTGGRPPPAPAAVPELADLPAPRRASALGDAPSKPAPRSALSDLEADLPAPRPRGPAPAPGAGNVDELAAPDEAADLPAPKARSARPVATPGGPDAADLLAPRPRAAGADPLGDLPAPRPGGRSAAPAGGDLFGDLPAPKPGGRAAAAPQDPFGDLPAPRAAEVAPKGFFDDLPQPAKGGKAGTDVAPKGFFDDLPQPAKGGKAGTDVAPKGFFDDLPQPARGGKPALDLGSSAGGIDLGAPVVSLDGPPAASWGQPGATAYDNVDLHAPPPGGAPGSDTPPPPPEDEFDRAAISFKPKKPGAPATAPGRPTPLPSISTKQAAEGLTVEGESPIDSAAAARAAKNKDKLKGKPKGKLTAEELEAQRVQAAISSRRRKRALATVLGLALLGGGGTFFYQRHAAAQARADEIASNLAAARAALASDAPDRWQKAALATAKVLALEPKHAAALGIGAEVAIAGAFADGKNMSARIAGANRMISDALGAGLTGPELERAQAVALLTTAPDKAVARLQALVSKTPTDGLLALYLGWAHAGAGNATAAIKAFDQAIAATPGIKVLALLGRARMNLLNAQAEAARADYTAVLAIDATNITAQVGLASTLPQAQAQQQEADLLAILARKDVKSADPRALVQAHVLVGDIGRRSGRLDTARQRYREALSIDPRDLDATSGLAEVELREKKFDTAQELITKALTQARDDVRAQLVASEIEIAKGKLEDAEARVEALANRKPPLPPIEQAHLELVRGRLLEKKGEHDKAIDAFVTAAKLAGDYDLTPTMAAVTKLSDQAVLAFADGNAEREAALRDRADQLLSGLATKAEKDLSLSLTLGMAYLQAGDPLKAEPMLRRVLEVRPNDVDALFQLGMALGRQKRGDEALEQLQKAQAAAPDRAEIGRELALTFESLGRDDQAGPIYAKLVTLPDPTLETRAYAGTFFVRKGKLADAGKQGEAILQIDKTAPVGHWLRGEGLLAQDQADEARKAFTEAVSLERNPRYLDAQGRALERLSGQRNNDIGIQDAALRAYISATEIDKSLYTSQVGQGRLYVLRREMTKAVPPLIVATQLRPDSAEAAALLGAAYQGSGIKKTAIQWLNEANKLKPSAEAYYRLGQLYTDPEINEDGPAVSSFTKATQLAFEDMKTNGTPQPLWYADALYSTGRLSFDQGNEYAAKRAWEQWLGLKPPPGPGAKRTEVERALATSLKSVGNPNP